VTPRLPFNPRSKALTIPALLLAMVSFMMGAALAKQLFPRVGVTGTTALRLGFAALILTAVWRPWRLRPSRREWFTILVYGAAMGWMNLFFYLALARIPLAIAVAVEFTGPLTVAIATSRRAVDFLWVAAAALGLILLLPLGVHIAPGAFGGMAFALAAGFCWAIYIVFGKRAGTLHGAEAAALGTSTAAILIVPIGVSQAGLAMFSPAILPVGLGLAVLSSALPYSLELFVLSRMPARTYGIMASMAPALGALSGRIFVGEALTAVQWIAIGCIMLASAGSAATTREARHSSAD
jgi:inner membrane transporter RhtA